MKLWIEACGQCRQELPRDVDETLDKYEKAQDYDAQEYKDAVLEFYKLFVCRAKHPDGKQPFPDPFMNTEHALEEDNTVYFTMASCWYWSGHDWQYGRMVQVNSLLSEAWRLGTSLNNLTRSVLQL